MTYNVFGGTLSLTQSIVTVLIVSSFSCSSIVAAYVFICFFYFVLCLFICQFIYLWNLFIFTWLVYEFVETCPVNKTWKYAIVLGRKMTPSSHWQVPQTFILVNYVSSFGRLILPFIGCVADVEAYILTGEHCILVSVFWCEDNEIPTMKT